MVREETWEAFVADSLLYAKVKVSQISDSDSKIDLSVTFRIHV